MNLKRFDTASETRGSLESRYAWPLVDANGEAVHLFQGEWVKHPPSDGGRRAAALLQWPDASRCGRTAGLVERSVWLMGPLDGVG